MSATVKPPLCHKISAENLKVGDHIYRRLNGIKSAFGYHHGIVTMVPDANEQKVNLMTEIKVIEMTSDGIKESELKSFLNEWDCRLVYYNTPKICETIHASGTCHAEPSSTIDEILERAEYFRPFIEDEKLNQYNNKDLYNLFKINCEEFAIYIKTGLCKGVGMTQLMNLAINASCVVELGQAAGSQSVIRVLSKVITYTVEGVMDDAGNVLANATKNMKIAAEGAKQAGKKVSKVKLSGTGVAIGIGIAVAIELACTAHKIYKYKKNYKYTKCDLKRDLTRGWSTTAITTGVGIGAAALGAGWWALIPCLVVGFGLTYAWHHFGWMNKSSKEKHYKDKGLTKNSSLKELRKARHEIRLQIRDEKLHPDQWINMEKKQLSKKQRQKRLEKFMFLQQFMEWLEQDIEMGHVSFDGEDTGNNNESTKALVC